MALRIVEDASLTDVGRQRSSNEDSYYHGDSIYAVADGMGGALAGEVASRMAVEVFTDMPDEDAPPEAKLEAIAKEANRRIYELAQSDESRAGMGCTLTAVMVHDGEVTLGHVGDSRAYVLREDKLEQITNDHSLVEELVRQGKLTPEEAEVHPQRSIITRALGPEPDVEVDAFTHPAKAGDVYLLCSDGLSGMVPDERIAEILRARSSLDQAAHALIDAANENGGRDNITAVLFRLGDGGDGGDDPDTLSGRETNVAIDAEAIREGTTVSHKTTSTQETKPTKTRPDGEAARDLTRLGHSTIVLDGEEAQEAREEAEAERTRRSSSPGRRPPTPPPRRRRGVTALIAVLVIAAVIAGLYAGSRQFWFVGTNGQGLLTLYRGLPYELPLGLDLYTQEYVSSVPVASIRNSRQRERILDHQLRERGDAVDLIRERERVLTGS